MKARQRAAQDDLAPANQANVATAAAGRARARDLDTHDLFEGICEASNLPKPAPAPPQAGGRSRSAGWLRRLPELGTHRTWRPPS